MNFGLEDNVIRDFASIFSKYPEIDEVILYGSRATGKYKPGSDIDLTIKGKGLNLALINNLSYLLDDLYLPYTLDLSIFSHIENDALIDHINRVGVPIYKQGR